MKERETELFAAHQRKITQLELLLNDALRSKRTPQAQEALPAEAPPAELQVTPAAEVPPAARPLPPGWRLVPAKATNEAFYYNRETKAKQFHHPLDQSPSSSDRSPTPSPPPPSLKRRRHHERPTLLMSAGSSSSMGGGTSYSITQLEALIRTKRAELAYEKEPRIQAFLAGDIARLESQLWERMR